MICFKNLLEDGCREMEASMHFFEIGKTLVKLILKWRERSERQLFSKLRTLKIIIRNRLLYAEFSRSKSVLKIKNKDCVVSRNNVLHTKLVT